MCVLYKMIVKFCTLLPYMKKRIVHIVYENCTLPSVYNKLYIGLYVFYIYYVIFVLPCLDSTFLTFPSLWFVSFRIVLFYLTIPVTL